MTIKGQNNVPVRQYGYSILTGLIGVCIILIVFTEMSIGILITGGLVIFLVILNLSSRFRLSIVNGKIDISQKVLGLYYRKFTFNFTEQHLKSDQIVFTNSQEKLIIQKHEGNGEFWFDFPKCILVSLNDKSFGLCPSELLEIEKLTLKD